MVDIWPTSAKGRRGTVRVARSADQRTMSSMSPPAWTTPALRASTAVQGGVARKR